MTAEMANISRKILLVIFFSSLRAEATGGPSVFSGWVLNPELHFVVNESTPVGDGFIFRASNEQLEVNVRGVPQKNIVAAKQMAAIEFANIKNLYSPHANPYRGQITALVQCGPQFSPQIFDLKIGSLTTKALVAGANARKNFGSCVQTEILYWAEYFNFYDERSLKFIEVRLFEKRKPGADKTVSSAMLRLKKISSSLLIPAASKAPK
jgi:hypothetical protein